jgi:hypothetical protein
MIKVEMPDSNRMYSLLTSSQKQNRFGFPGDEWKEDDSPIAIRMGPLEMISPLDFVAQSFVRNSNRYSSSLEVHSRDPSCFINLSSSFGRKIATHNGLTFHPTTKDLTGYIVNPNNPKVPISVVSSFDENFLRTLSVGALGARNLELGGLDDFKIELGMLNNYANMLINCVYENHSLSNEGLVIPDIKLNFFQI